MNPVGVHKSLLLATKISKTKKIHEVILEDRKHFVRDIPHKWVEHISHKYLGQREVYAKCMPRSASSQTSDSPYQNQWKRAKVFMNWSQNCLCIPLSLRIQQQRYFPLLRSLEYVRWKNFSDNEQEIAEAILQQIQSRKCIESSKDYYNRYIDSNCRQLQNLIKKVFSFNTVRSFQPTH